MHGQSTPWIEDEVIFLEHKTLLGERALWWKLDEANCVVWGCGFVPYDTCVLSGVVLRGCTELDMVPSYVRRRVEIRCGLHLETSLGR